MNDSIKCSGVAPPDAFPRRRFLGGLAAVGSAVTLPAGVFGQAYIHFVPDIKPVK